VLIGSRLSLHTSTRASRFLLDKNFLSAHFRRLRLRSQLGALQRQISRRFGFLPCDRARLWLGKTRLHRSPK